MMKSSTKSILNIIRRVKLSLIISSCFTASCSQVPEKQRSQALINDFTYREFYQNKTQWELQAQKAEVFSTNRAKISDLIVDLKAPQFSFSLQSKQGTLGEKGMTMQAPVSIQIPDYHLSMELSQIAQWNRNDRTFTSQNVSLRGKTFKGTGQKMTLTYPYERLQLSSVNFVFARE